MADPSVLINDAKDYANESVSEAIERLDAEIAEVTGLADSFTFMNTVPYTEYISVSTRIYEVLNLLQTEVPDRPRELGEYSLGFPPSFAPVDTTLLQNSIQNMVSVIALIPDRINEALDIIDIVTGKVRTDLLEGGYGIDPSDEEALWDRARDRETWKSNTSIEELKRQFAAYGMPIPQGAFIKMVEKSIEDVQDALGDINRDISIKRADLYRTARDFAMTKGIELAKEQFGFLDMKVKVLRDVAVAQYEALRLEIENHKELLAKYGFELQRAFKDQEVKIGIYEADIKAWTSRLNALISANEVAQRGQANQLEADRLTLETAVERAKGQILAFNAEVNARVQNMQGIVSVLSNKVAGALSGINAIAASIEQIG